MAGFIISFGSAAAVGVGGEAFTISIYSFPKSSRLYLLWTVHVVTYET